MTSRDRQSSVVRPGRTRFRATPRQSGGRGRCAARRGRGRAAHRTRAGRHRRRARDRRLSPQDLRGAGRDHRLVRLGLCRGARRPARVRPVPARRLSLHPRLAAAARPGAAAGRRAAAAARPARSAGPGLLWHRRVPGGPGDRRAARLGERLEHDRRQPDDHGDRPRHRLSGRAPHGPRMARRPGGLRRRGDHLGRSRRRPALRRPGAVAAAGGARVERLLRLPEAAAAALHGL